jgi:hypothetical protein
LSLGSVIQTQVDLYTVTPTKTDAPQMNRICPEHHLKLSQVHHCPEGDGHYVTEFILGLPTGSGYLVPTEDKPQVDATEVLNLTPVPANEVADHTISGTSRFYLAPSHPTASQPWQVILNLVQRNKVALVTKAALRRGMNEKLWRVIVFRDVLVLAEIVFPSAILDPPDVDQVKVDKAITKLTDEFVTGLMSTWDKVDKTNTAAQRMEQWLSTATEVDSPDVQVKVGDKDAAESLMAALAAAVEKRQ